MYPSISTRSVAASCTTAGSRPSFLSQASVSMTNVGASVVIAHLDPLLAQMPLQFSDPHRAGMEHAGRQRGIGIGLAEHLGEVRDLARAARRHQRNAAALAHRAKLPDVVAGAHAVAAHAVEDDLACSALLRF